MKKLKRREEQQEEEEKRDAKRFKKEPKPDEKNNGEDEVINEIKRGEFMGILDLNEFDLDQLGARIGCTRRSRRRLSML